MFKYFYGKMDVFGPLIDQKQQEDVDSDEDEISDNDEVYDEEVF